MKLGKLEDERPVIRFKGNYLNSWQVINGKALRAAYDVIKSNPPVPTKCKYRQQRKSCLVLYALVIIKITYATVGPSWQ